MDSVHLFDLELIVTTITITVGSRKILTGTGWIKAISDSLGFSVSKVVLSTLIEAARL